MQLLADIFDDLVKSHDKSYRDKKWDGQWRQVTKTQFHFKVSITRPLPLLIGVLYKIQERKQSQKFHIGRPLYNEKENVLALLGYYWHMLKAADFNIRRGTNDVEQSMVMNVIKDNT